MQRPALVRTLALSLALALAAPAVFAQQAQTAAPMLDYGYVLDTEQRLLGIVSLVRLLASSADQTVQNVMSRTPITVDPGTDQEVVSQLFRDHHLTALPVVFSGIFGQ